MAQKLTNIETTLMDIQSKKDEELNSFKELVGDMLEHFPENTLMRCKSGFEEATQQVMENYEAIQNLEVRMSSIKEAQAVSSIYSDNPIVPDIPVAAVANELEERNKRKRSVVLHNAIWRPPRQGRG